MKVLKALFFFCFTNIALIGPMARDFDKADLNDIAEKYIVGFAHPKMKVEWFQQQN